MSENMTTLEAWRQFFAELARFAGEALEAGAQATKTSLDELAKNIEKRNET